VGVPGLRLAPPAGTRPQESPAPPAAACASLSGQVQDLHPVLIERSHGRKASPRWYCSQLTVEAGQLPDQDTRGLLPELRRDRLLELLKSGQQLGSKLVHERLLYPRHRHRPWTWRITVH